MNKTEMNVAIAEAVGWKRVETSNFGVLWLKPGEQEEGDTIYQGSEIPNYTEDLNAMNEVVWKTLDPEGKDRFIIQLKKVVGPQFGFPFEFVCMNADADQRAEAFLKTIGKWKECPPPSDPVTVTKE